MVDTSAGYIQFGAPPETLKDTIKLPNSVPEIFVLPKEHFNVQTGMSTAEIEFPIYFNFYIRKKKTRVILHESEIANMKVALNEAAFGPEKVEVSNEYEKGEGFFVPDLKAEIEYFRAGNSLDRMVEFIPLSEGGTAIENTMIKERSDGSFEVFDGGVRIAEVPDELQAKMQMELGSTIPEAFEPPEFAITCLGPSHGFDPEDNTSGFILWLSKMGVMVDPPVNSTEWLKASNVNPRFIDSIILTHCHADHDSGTFQKILEEGKIKIYTTPTIMESFLKKYSALTKMPAAELLELTDFQPVKMNVQYNINGAVFSFYYSLHSIPTIGFHMSYRDKTFLYSSDHLNHPERIEEMYSQNVLTKERRDFLLDFPWESDIIYHEAGVPPLHTPISYLNSLPEDVQKRITVYHIAKKDFPEKTSLKLAKFGIGETVYPKIEKHRNEEAYQILNTFSRIDIFSHLPNAKWKDLLLIVDTEKFHVGEKIIEKDTPGDKFYVIATGNVKIEGVEGISGKVYGSYDYFGEASLLLGTLRGADVVAQNDVTAYSIKKDAFLRLIRHTEVEAHIRRVAVIRDEKSWKAIHANPYFADLTPAQVTHLEEILSPVEFKKGDVLPLIHPDGEEYTYLLSEGQITFEDGSSNSETLFQGAFIYGSLGLSETENLHKRYICKSGCTLYRSGKKDYLQFLDDNPGVKMKLIYKNRSI